MATNINNYDGTLLVSIPDGTIDSSSSSIKFPGKGFVNYGESVNENMLWIMQNFASASAPSLPVNGQTWFDTSTLILKVYNSALPGWIASDGIIRASSAPGSASGVGSLWYDTTKDQLHAWDGAAWLLVGPLGASDNIDPLNPAVPAYSRFEAIRISDTSAGDHQAWRLIIGGTIVAIFSDDPSYNTTVTGFSTINPGLNLNSSISGIGVTGDATVFRSTQDNLPIATTTYNLGSPSRVFANVYSTLFTGTATAARYADVAERYQADASYAPGTVVKLGGTAEVTASSTPGDNDVFGIVSTNPGYLLNSEAGDDATYPAIALVGRVPCKVVGQVAKFQRLMASSNNGVACAWDPAFGQLAIIGRSLVEKATHGVEAIEVVVGKN